MILLLLFVGFVSYVIGEYVGVKKVLNAHNEKVREVDAKYKLVPR